MSWRNHKGIGKSSRKIDRSVYIACEAIEARILLSGTFVPPIWAAELAGPPAPPGESVGGPTVVTVDPENGDTLVAFSAHGADGDLVVAAFKSDGSGGLALDTTFGDQSNDPDISATPGYEVADMNLLFGVDAADAYSDSGAQIGPIATGISVEYSGGTGSGNIDVLFGLSGGFDGGCGFGLMQLTGGTGTGGAWGTLNTDFGNSSSFEPLADDFSNWQANLEAYGAEIVDVAPQQTDGEVGAFGNGITYDSYSDDGSGDILVAGAVGPGNAQGLHFGDDAGGAVFALDTATGAFDGSFGSYGGDVVIIHADTSPHASGDDPMYSEGEADSICVDPSDGNIYVAGIVRDDYDDGGVGDPFGNFVNSFAPDGASGGSYTISDLASSTGNLDVGVDFFGAALGVQILSNGNVVAGFSGEADGGSGVALVALNTSLTETTALWSSGPGESWVSNPTDTGNPSAMAVNPSNGDIAIAYMPGFDYAQAIWISGTTGAQEALSDATGNAASGSTFGSPVFQSDGSLTIAGVIGPGYDEAPPSFLTLADYQWDNSLPAWLTSSNSFLAWNPATEKLNLFGPATIIADPSTYGDNPIITENGSQAQLEIAPTTDTAVHVDSLTLEDGASAQLAESATPDGLIFYLNSLNIASNSTFDATNNEMIIDYGTGSDPIATIASYLASGYAAGTWGGTGIDSSAAAALTESSGNVYDLGYGDGVDGEVAGLAPGFIEVKFTLAGDANLDGTVNSEDFSAWSHHLGQSGCIWDQGDFNYDGTVNSEDLTLWEENVGKTI
jgi:hypothetical protein